MRHSHSDFRLTQVLIVTLIKRPSIASSISRADIPFWSDSLVGEDCMTINPSFNCTIAYCTSDVSHHHLSRRISFLLSLFFFPPTIILIIVIIVRASMHPNLRDSHFARARVRDVACVHQVNLMPHSCTKREHKCRHNCKSVVCHAFVTLYHLATPSASLRT